jgi:deoxyadenosine/deoxycytidine kinase
MCFVLCRLGIGDKSVSQHPDLIVVLGCNRPGLDKRIAEFAILTQHYF